MFVIFVIALTIPFTSTNNLCKCKNDYEPLSNCVLEIAEFRNYSKMTVVLYEQDQMDVLFDLFQEVIVSSIIDKQIPFIVTNNLNDLYNVSVKSTNYFLVVIYHKSCNNTVDIIFNKGTKYLVFIDEIFHSKCINMLTRIRQEVENYDVTFVIKNKIDRKYDIITVVPNIDRKTCELDDNVTVKNINSCVNGTLEINGRSHIFPSKKAENLKLCKFNVGLATLFPYSVVDNKESLKSLDPLKEIDIYGSDVAIMKIIAKQFNATLTLYYIERDEENPFLHTEYVEYLLNGTLDACAGGLYNIYGDVVAYSGIYSRQSIIWMYTVERKSRSWQQFLEKSGGLYIFLLFQATYSIIWKLLCRFDGHEVALSSTIIYSLGTLVGTTSLQEGRSLKQKILNISYLILCLHLSSYIGTQMYYYLTVDNPPHTIKTIDELIESDRVPYLAVTRKYFLNNEKYIAFANTSRDCVDFEDCEKSVLKYRGSTIILDGFLPPLQSLTAVNDEARVMRVNEDVLVVYHEMIMRKNSSLVGKFQKIVERLFEAGICDKLYKEAIGVTVVDKANTVVKNILTNSYSCTGGCKITWTQLAGSFYLWMIGCGLACCCFIIELFRKR